MKEKMTPHIIAAGALVVFIVLGLACASTPKPPNQNYKPPIPLTQEIMKFDDPRMPMDLFDDTGERIKYYIGTFDDKNPLSKQGFLDLTLNDGGNGNLLWIRIDGKTYNGFTEKRVIGLAPGRHTFYSSSTGKYYLGNDSYVDIGSLVNLEFDVEPGKCYCIKRTVGQSALDQYKTRLHGYGNFDISFKVVESNIYSEYKKPSLLVGRVYDDKIIYLEPYDSNVPLSSQSFINLANGEYIIDFNGNKVCWGAGSGDRYKRSGYIATIGIPAGKHELQIAHLDFNNKFSKPETLTLDAIPQHRYSIWPKKDKTNYFIDLLDYPNMW